MGAFGRFGQPIGPAPADAFTRRFPRVVRFVASDVDVRDAATGAVVYAVPAGEHLYSWAAGPDASRLYVSGSSAFSGFVRAIDVASRAVVAEVPGFFGSLVWVPGDRLIALQASGPNAFDRDLRPIAEVNLNSRCPPAWFISEHTGRAYFLVGGGYTGSDITTSLVVFDTVAGRKIGEVNLNALTGAGFGCGAGATLWTAPGPPQRLNASVLGRDVTLSWLATDLAEGYVLDVGLAPGRTDLTYFVGASTRVTFANAPPGTYYVRARAGNVMGGGRPSAEVQVVVP